MTVVHGHALALGVLAALQLSTIGGAGLVTTRLRRAQVSFSVVLLLLSASWLLVDHPFEGPTLWVVTAGHGLTVGDLLAAPGLALAAIALVTSCRHRPTAPSVSEVAKRRALARLV